nr:hypothetical protein HmN_000560900 [Hymenolepis microstoma]
MSSKTRTRLPVSACSKSVKLMGRLSFSLTNRDLSTPTTVYAADSQLGRSTWSLDSNQSQKRSDEETVITTAIMEGDKQ